jgi:hypothetical protein
MMVNQLNNNSTPWQSTIPNQMPWLNSVATNPPIQFGQSTFAPAPVDPSVALSTTSPLVAPLPAQPAAIELTGQIQTPTPSHLLNNPFNPQQQMAPAPQLNDNPVLASQQCSIYPIDQPVINGPVSPIRSGHFESSFLTQLPQQQNNNTTYFESQPLHQKRSSMEMEDEMTEKEAPPTKQQLSESRLFKRFGSLQLDGETTAKGDDQDDEIDSDDSDDGRLVSSNQDRKEFDRYVYLLFKDKKSNNLFTDSQSLAMDRLIRDERDKLNKAVILWNPPMKNIFVNEPSDSDDDEEITYKDHRDFLKNRTGDDDSIIITEVQDDIQIEEVFPTEADDVMQD